MAILGGVEGEGGEGRGRQLMRQALHLWRTGVSNLKAAVIDSVEASLTRTKLASSPTLDHWYLSGQNTARH